MNFGIEKMVTDFHPRQLIMRLKKNFRKKICKTKVFQSMFNDALSTWFGLILNESMYCCIEVISLWHY